MMPKALLRSVIPGWGLHVAQAHPGSWATISLTRAWVV